MPIWLERFALVVLAGIFVPFIILNTLKLDTLQRSSLGVAIVALSIFVAQTLYLHKKSESHPNPETVRPAQLPPLEPKIEASPHKAIHRPHTPSISQQGQNNIAQIGNNNQAVINPEPPERRWEMTVDICQRLLAPIKTDKEIQVSLGAFISDPDGANVVQQLSKCFQNVRAWKFNQAVLPPVPEGVKVVASIENEPIAEMLKDGLIAVGFNAEIKIIPNLPDIEVWIGKHAIKQN